MAELRKNGSATDCDNYQGILTSDHKSQAFTDLLGKVLKPSLQCRDLGGTERGDEWPRS